MNIAALMQQANNCYAFKLQGPPNTNATFFIANTALAGQEIAYTIDDLQELPAQFDLLESAPNPFQSQTKITYHIPERRTTGLPVHLAIYDAWGRRVRTLVEGQRFPGRFTVQWDGTGNHGRRLANGVYFGRLVAGEMHSTIQIVLLR